MRLVLLIALLNACAHPSSPPAKPESPAPAALDDEAVKRRARAFLEAVDRSDADGLREIVTPGFGLFEEGGFVSTQKFLEIWDKSERPDRTRTCTDESVHRSPAALVYVGDCKENQPADGDKPAQTWQGWNTVVLVPDGDAWKVAFWQWQRSGVAGEKIRWNDVYRRDTGFRKTPNELLVRTVADRPAGKALVLAMGQGRNALYLAEAGWQVTGVDLSEVGVYAARAAAAERGLQLDAVVANLDEYELGEERWDLITMIYAGNSPDWIARAKRALKPGGLFVCEYFFREADAPKGGFGAGELAAAFEGWQILEDDVVEAEADWGMSKQRLVRFIAQKP